MLDAFWLESIAPQQSVYRPDKFRFIFCRYRNHRRYSDVIYEPGIGNVICCQLGLQQRFVTPKNQVGKLGASDSALWQSAIFGCQ